MDKRSLFSAASALAFIAGLSILSYYAFLYLSGQENMKPSMIVYALIVIMAGLYLGKKARKLKK